MRPFTEQRPSKPSLETEPLLDKALAAKLIGWKAKSISYSGTLVLLKSVLILMGLKQFLLSAFVIQKGTLKHMERIFKSFLWAEPELKKSNHSFSMEGILFPTNLAYGSIESRKTTFAFIRIRGSIFRDVRPSYHTSNILRSILSIRDVLKRYIRSIIGDGSNSLGQYLA